MRGQRRRSCVPSTEAVAMQPLRDPPTVAPSNRLGSNLLDGKVTEDHWRFLPLVVLVVLVLAPMWRLVLMRGTMITDDVFASDLMNEGFPYRHALSTALAHGEWPLWFTEIYGGYPLLARADAGACYPLNLLLYGLCDPYVALNLSILLTMLVGSTGMYFYTRDIGVSRRMAVVAGFAFAYSGFMVVHAKHPSMVDTVCWFPFGLFVLERLLRSGEDGQNRRLVFYAGLFALVFGTHFLAGHIQTAYYAGLVYCFYSATRILSRRGPDEKRGEGFAGRLVRRGRKPVSVAVVGAMAVGSLIAAVQVIPTYELVGLTQRGGGVSFDYSSEFPYDPADLAMFVYPLARGNMGDMTYRSHAVFWEDYGYVGLVVLSLAVVGVFRSWRQWHTRFFVVAALVALVLVLGSNTPAYRIVFTLFPGMKFFRFPTRCMFVVDTALIVLAAKGWTTVFARGPEWSRRGCRSLVGLVVLGAAVTDLLFFQLRQNSIVDSHVWREPPLTATRLNQDHSLFRLYSPFGRYTHRAAFASAHGWDGDLKPFVDQREFLQPDLNVLFGLSSADGYAELTPNYVVDVWGDQNRPGVISQLSRVHKDVLQTDERFQRLMNMFNVRYVLSLIPIWLDHLRPLERIGAVLVYENPEVMPRAYLVGRSRVVRSDAEALETILSSAFDPWKDVVITGDGAPKVDGSENAGVATVRSYRRNGVVVDVDAAGPSYLVLSDTFFPGWRATVDGKPTRIVQANVCQRAVAVESGHHQVRFSFVPLTVIAGLLVTVLGLGVSGVLLVIGRRRSIEPGHDGT